MVDVKISSKLGTPDLLETDLSNQLGASLHWRAPKHIRPGSMTLVTVSSISGERSVLISPQGVTVVESGNYLVAPKQLSKPKNTPIKNAFVLSSRVIGWILVGILFSFSLLNMSGVIKSQIVLTESMSPIINPGDMVISASAERLVPKVGDVVVYTGKRFDGTEVAPFAHRIIAGDATTGFTVKGDNNPDADIQKPVLSDIQGVVFLTIPFVGKLFNPQIFLLLLLCGFGVWLVLKLFRDK
jgi:signal peptidase I